MLGGPTMPPIAERNVLQTLSQHQNCLNAARPEAGRAATTTESLSYGAPPACHLLACLLGPHAQPVETANQMLASTGPRRITAPKATRSSRNMFNRHVACGPPLEWLWIRSAKTVRPHAHGGTLLPALGFGAAVPGVHRAARGADAALVCCGVVQQVAGGEAQVGAVVLGVLAEAARRRGGRGKMRGWRREGRRGVRRGPAGMGYGKGDACGGTCACAGATCTSAAGSGARDQGGGSHS